MNEVSIEYFTDNYYKEYSMYVLEQRAIPSYIDGFKPVQRKLIYASLKLPKDKEVKVSELGASIASCVSGDTVIDVNGNFITIAEYYSSWKPTDIITAFDENTLESISANVLDVIKKEPKEIFILELEDSTTLEVTAEHLVMTRDRSWQKVSDLLETDYILKY